jgi:hypothetical protein
MVPECAAERQFGRGNPPNALAHPRRGFVGGDLLGGIMKTWTPDLVVVATFVGALFAGPYAEAAGAGKSATLIAAMAILALLWAAAAQICRRSSSTEAALEASLTNRLITSTLGGAFATVDRIRSIHARTFPRTIQDRGSTGKDITPTVQTAVPPRATGRQGGAGVARRQASGAKSDDDGDDDGEPPHKCYTYENAAQLLDCSPKTLRNKVSAGLIPAPVQTAVGPRFTAAQIRALIDPPLPTPQKAAPKRRGRPRIATQRDGEVSK